MSFARSVICWTTLLTVATLAACDSGPPAGAKYYERVIQPILTNNCVFNQGACHKDDGSGNALGNLDLSSYQAISKRKDVLRTFGPYPVPLLLLKAAGADVPPIPYKGDPSVTDPAYETSEIVHAGKGIPATSNAYFELLRWLSNGATEDGSVATRPKQIGTGSCRTLADAGSTRADVLTAAMQVDTTSAAFADFKTNVEPMLTQSCAYSNCHSAVQSDFFLVCADSPQASQFNFLEAQAFIANPPDTSPILLRPLAPSAGGLTHTGGVFFADKSDPSWVKLQAWAEEAGVSPTLTGLSDGQKFFTASVMPVLLKRGCALEACHSPGAANDFKLRVGSQGGYLSAFALEGSYRVARQFLVPELPDVRQSRLVKKPIIARTEGGVGLIHRGGPPLQSPADPPGLDPTLCPQPWTAMSTPFCTVVEWHRLERLALLSGVRSGFSMASGTTLPLIAVVRQTPDADKLIEFSSYRPGADLVMSQVALSDNLGAIDPASATTPQTLLDQCPGSATTRDVRGPEVSYDGSKVIFALRTGMSDSLTLYEVALNTHVCAAVDTHKPSASVHDLDPMYAPDGTIVFASTRSGTLSPKYLLPETDLWRVLPGGAPERMTALSGSEMSPAIMASGQLSMTTEKATPDFYQLSGRRINWDLTDYHPLLAQRATSPGADGSMHPSVGFQQATEIRQAADQNFAIILSNENAQGAGGTLALFNRSIGPFEADRSDTQFLKSMVIVDGAATGTGATRGAYRAPFPLPDGRILVSYAPEVTNLDTASAVRYDLVVVDPDPTGVKRTPVANFSTGSASVTEALLVYPREQRPLFSNVAQLIFGGHSDPSDPAHAWIHYPDLPMLATLLGANLRTGRAVDDLRSAKTVSVYAAQPATDATAARAAQTGSEKVYDQRQRLGSAPLASDGSVQIRVPALTPLFLELDDESGKPLFAMTEEDQVGPGEHVSRGVPQPFFNSVCGGCHGSVSGRELDIAIDSDALTGASVSLSRDQSTAQTVGP